MKIINCDYKYFIKVKESEVCDDKNHDNVIDYNARDKILSGELNR